MPLFNVFRINDLIKAEFERIRKNESHEPRNYKIAPGIQKTIWPDGRVKYYLSGLIRR